MALFHKERGRRSLPRASGVARGPRGWAPRDAGGRPALGRKLPGNSSRTFRSKQWGGIARTLPQDIEAGKRFEVVKSLEVPGRNRVAERALREVVLASTIASGSGSGEGSVNDAIPMPPWQRLRQRRKHLLRGAVAPAAGIQGLTTRVNAQSLCRVAGASPQPARKGGWD